MAFLRSLTVVALAALCVACGGDDTHAGHDAGGMSTDPALAGGSGAGGHDHGPAPIAGPAPVEHATVVGEWVGSPLYRTTVWSPAHTIDRIYRSMEGPRSNVNIRPMPRERELIWLTGYDASMTNVDRSQKLPQEFMCHSTLAAGNGRRYGRLLPSAFHQSRLFTLAQGQFEVRFPEGFGIPFLSDDVLRLESQVLNHNLDDQEIDVRHQVSIEFVRDRELAKEIIPLTLTGVYGQKLVKGESGHFQVDPDDVDPDQHGMGCSIGEGVNANHDQPDQYGRVFTAHWIVKPGREVNHTLVTHQLKLPYDTTIHYVAAHLHPYGESLELRDLTTGETVLKTRGRSATDRIALEEVEYISSPEGIPIFADHEYELVSVYDNPTGVDQDAMATLYLYVRVKDVEVAEIRRRAAAIHSATRG